MIQLKDVFFRYKNGEEILKGISYTFEDNEKYVILGENGSGKTTLLRLLCGLLKITRGSIEYPKNQITSFLPDNNGIYENMTVLENIKFRISLYNLSYENLNNYINELLTAYDLLLHKDRFVSHLSLGMKKKTALICTYVIQPDLLILDEPTGGIDSKSTEELIAALNLASRKNSITIITSHDRDLINGMDAKKITLEKGIFATKSIL